MEECKQIRKRILELAYKVKSSGSHLGGSLSSVEILCALYNLINFNPGSRERDRVIISKGHAALALFCILEWKGLLKKEELDSFEQDGTCFFAHAKRNTDKGLEFSGGSLSLGASYAVGVALACKSNGLKNHIYVLLGDGECDEGLVWEAVMSASHYKLNNITFIVDNNGLQSDGLVTDVMNSGSLEEKFNAFGCFSQSVDGHNYDALVAAINNKSLCCPNAIVAHTIKGKGVSFMEQAQQWHHGILNEEQYIQALNEIQR